MDRNRVQEDDEWDQVVRPHLESIVGTLNATQLLDKLYACRLLGREQVVNLGKPGLTQYQVARQLLLEYLPRSGPPMATLMTFCDVLRQTDGQAHIADKLEQHIARPDQARRTTRGASAIGSPLGPIHFQPGRGGQHRGPLNAVTGTTIFVTEQFYQGCFVHKAPHVFATLWEASSHLFSSQRANEFRFRVIRMTETLTDSLADGTSPLLLLDTNIPVVMQLHGISKDEFQQDSHKRSALETIAYFLNIESSQITVNDTVPGSCILYLQVPTVAAIRMIGKLSTAQGRASLAVNMADALSRPITSLITLGGLPAFKVSSLVLPVVQLPDEFVKDTRKNTEDQDEYQELREAFVTDTAEEEDGSLTAAFPQNDFLAQVLSGPKCGFLDVKIRDNGSLYQLYVPKKGSCDGEHNQCLYMRLEHLPPSEQLEELAMSITDGTPPPQVIVFLSEQRSTGRKKVNLRVLIRPTTASDFKPASIAGDPDEPQGSGMARHLSSVSVCIIGLGSRGSQIALQLAKEGVGHFILVDNKRLTKAEISMHACSLEDVGRLKTNAVKDIIEAAGDDVHVSVFSMNIARYNNDPEFLSKVRDSNLVVCTTRDAPSYHNINTLCLELQKTAIFGLSSTTASRCEVVRLRNSPQAPCFTCLYSHESLMMFRLGSEQSKFRGLQCDVMPLVNMVSKLTLVELCRGKDTAIESLGKDLESDRYIWKNRQENENKPDIVDTIGVDQQILAWQPADTMRNPGCKVCQAIRGMQRLSGQTDWDENEYPTSFFREEHK